MEIIVTSELTNYTPTVSPEATASIHDDVIVIFHIGTGQIFSSNTIGAQIWSAIQQGMSLEATAKQISDAFEVTYFTAREHIVHFLDELQRHALIHKGAEV